MFIEHDRVDALGFDISPNKYGAEEHKHNAQHNREWGNRLLRYFKIRRCQMKLLAMR